MPEANGYINVGPGGMAEQLMYKGGRQYARAGRFNLKQIELARKPPFPAVTLLYRLT